MSHPLFPYTKKPAAAAKSRRKKHNWFEVAYKVILLVLAIWAASPAVIPAAPTSLSQTLLNDNFALLGRSTGHVVNDYIPWGVPYCCKPTPTQDVSRFTQVTLIFRFTPMQSMSALVKGVVWFEGQNATVTTVMTFGIANSTYASSVVLHVTQKLLYYYLVVDCNTGYCDFWQADAHVNVELFGK